MKGRGNLQATGAVQGATCEFGEVRKQVNDGTSESSRGESFERRKGTSGKRPGEECESSSPESLGWTGLVFVGILVRQLVSSGRADGLAARRAP